MKCSKCGFENRPEARFCKRCGQSLQAETAPPTAGTICPACGATAKPEARFCPRCGKPLAAEPAHPPSPTKDTEPSFPIPQPYTTPPSPPPPPAQAPTYAQPPSQPPPPAAPSAARRSLPRWLWWVGGIAVFLCVATLVVTAVVLGPKILGTEKEPTVTPTPTIAPPTEPPATETPTAIPPTDIPPTEVPTATPITETVTTSAFDAQIGISPSATELRVGELLTVTVTVINSGQVTFGDLRYQLLGELEPYLRVTTDAVVEHALEVAPDQSDVATFVLEAAQPGAARLQVNVTVKTREDPPSVKPVPSEYVVEISVIQ